LPPLWLDWVLGCDTGTVGLAAPVLWEEGDLASVARRSTLCVLQNLEPCSAPAGATMASKPEKRVASSVFITLAPPRRDVAVTEEVRQAACEARRNRPWESSGPLKASGAVSARRPIPWMPPGAAAALVPDVPPQLSNGGKRATSKGTRVEMAGQWRGRLSHSFIHSFTHSFIHQEPTVCQADSGVLPGYKSWLLHFSAV
jgi:hypothetical protein